MLNCKEMQESVVADPAIRGNLLDVKIHPRFFIASLEESKPDRVLVLRKLYVIDRDSFDGKM